MTGVVYAIYTRQSAEPRDGLSSCEGQFQTCLDFARAAARPGDRWIGERFDDTNASGRTLDRPALNRLRKRVRAGEVGRVYAVALDRYSRSLGDMVAMLEELEAAGVEVHVAHQPELSSGPEARLIRHILACFAQFEREMIAARIAETRSYLKRRGRRLAGPPPYGYDADPLTKQLVPNHAEARRVRAMFRRALEGQTPAEIAARIDHLGWRTKRRTAARSGRQVGGSRWTARTVLATLRNPVYAGMFADGGGTRPGCHPAIVDEAVFDAVQGRLDERRTAGARSRRPMPFPLRSLVVCPGCGRPLCTYVITRRRGKTTLAYRYYRCRSTAGGRAPCRGMQFQAGALEAAVREALTKPAAWPLQQAAPGGEAPTARALAAAWSALGVVEKHRMLPQLVARVEIRRRGTELRVTLSEQAREALEGLLGPSMGQTADPPVCM